MTGTESRTQIILSYKGRVLNIFIWSRKLSLVLVFLPTGSGDRAVCIWSQAADAQVCSNYVTGKAKPVKLQISIKNARESYLPNCLEKTVPLHLQE